MLEKERIAIINKKLKSRKLKAPSEIELVDEYEIDTCSLEDICKRAIISAIMAKCAFYLYEAENKQKIKDEYTELLKKYGVYDHLYDDELEVLNKEFNEPLCDTIAWRYQSSIALLWLLGLVENIDDAFDPEDVEDEICKIFNKIISYKTLDTLMSQANLKSTEELSDMFVLYWHYHWCIIDASLNGNRIDTLFYDVVSERRRALEWALFCNGEDWNFIMDT